LLLFILLLLLAVDVLLLLALATVSVVAVARPCEGCVDVLDFLHVDRGYGVVGEFHRIVFYLIGKNMRRTQLRYVNYYY
jgi:hypothetical protein